MGSQTGEPGRRKPPILGKAQLKVFAALEDLISELGHAPTYAQLVERIGWRSSGTLDRYLKELRALGVIEGRERSLRIVEPRPARPPS
jgi:SOS-response transcriptional repressor LexA